MRIDSKLHYYGTFTNMVNNDSNSDNKSRLRDCQIQFCITDSLFTNTIRVDSFIYEFSLLKDEAEGSHKQELRGVVARIFRK